MNTKSRWRAVLCVLCVMVVGGCQEQRGQRPPWTPMFGNLTTPVTITIVPWERNYPTYQQKYRKSSAEVTFVIPKNYLGNPFSGGGGKQARIDIEAGLKEDGSTELEPQKAIYNIPQGLDEAIHKRAIRKLHNGVVIHINYSSYTDGLQYKKPELFFVTNKLGLDGYLDKTYNPKGFFMKTPAGMKHVEGGREHYFNSIGSTYPPVHLECAREADVGGGCTAYTIHHDIPVVYIIRRHQFYRWQQFDTAVRQLIDQFIVSNDKEKHHVR